MNNLPSKQAIQDVIKQHSLDPSTPNFFEQVLIAWEFIHSQLCNGAQEGNLRPSKALVEAWAALYVSDDAVTAALHLHGIAGLNRKTVFPDPKRLERHALAGSHMNYTGQLHWALDEYFAGCGRPRLDGLGFAGVEGVGRKNADFAKAITEHRELLAPQHIQAGSTEDE